MFQDAELTVREYLEMLRRRRWFIAAVTIGITALATIPIALQTPVYASTSEIQLRSENSVSVFDDGDVVSEATRSRDLSTDVSVLTNRETRSLVVARLGPDGLPFTTVTAQVEGFSEIIRITVTAPSAAGAAEAANAFAEVYVDLRQTATTSALTAQATELRRQAQDLRTRQAEVDDQLSVPDLGVLTVENLRQERALLASQISEYGLRADQLTVDADLLREASKVVSRAPLNLTPIAPKTFRSGVIALGVGFLIGVCLAVFLEVIRDRMTNPGEMEAVDPDVSILASVPHVDIELDDPDHRLPPSAVEAFRYLWTAIRFQSMDDPVQSVLVTSSLSGEGKTTTAVNLALSLADSGSRVVLIDADMRKSAVHRRLGVRNQHGLSSVVAGTSTVADAIRFVRPNLAVMTSGPPTGAATDILGGERFIEMVRGLEAQSDLVIIDAPPVLPVADALLAARAVDRTLVVGRLGLVRRRELRSTLRRLRDSRIPVLGIVENDHATNAGYGGYGDSYHVDSAERVDVDA